jgi:hypothetical protein
LPCWPKPTTSIWPAAEVTIAENPLSSMVRSAKVRLEPVHGGPRRAEDEAVGSRAADELVVSDAPHERVITAVEVDEAGVPVARLERIVALAAIEVREPQVAADQEVVSRPAGGGAAEIARFQRQGVVAVAAAELVESPGAPDQRVVAEATVQNVVARQARDVVVAGEAEDLVVVGGADQRVVSLRAGGDEVRRAGEVVFREVQRPGESDREIRVVQLAVVVVVSQKPGAVTLGRVDELGHVVAAAR